MNKSFEFIKDLPKNGVGLYKCLKCGYFQAKYKHSIKSGRKSTCFRCEYEKLVRNTKHDWTFKERTGDKATYVHDCGREQDVDIHQMAKGAVSCRACDLDKIINLAAAKGFMVLSSSAEGFLCSCNVCHDTTVLQRYSITRKQTLRCKTCQETTWKNNAEDTSWRFVSRIDGNYGTYQHSCGCSQKLRHTHVLNANPVCSSCFETEKRLTSARHGWDWLVKVDKKASLYRHSCGNEQVLQDGHMKNGNVRCHGCNQSWLDRGNNLYMIRVSSKDGTVNFIKVGIAYDVDRRIKSFKLNDGFVTSKLTVKPFNTGKDAITAEKAIHKELRMMGITTYNSVGLMLSGYTECYADTVENLTTISEAVHRDRKQKTTSAERALLLT